jgi:hypothetical protein
MIMTSGNLPMDAALPTRADVERRWVSLIQGGITRDEVHAWAARWVETGGLGQIPDLMIRNALQHLHGYDLTRDSENPEVLRHDSNGIHVRTDRQIAEEFEEWHSNCLAYDRDPQGYVQSARNRGRDALQGLECDPDAGLAESILRCTAAKEGAAAEHGYDLQVAEQTGGDTIARHVGLSAEQLLTRNIPYASSRYREVAIRDLGEACHPECNGSIRRDHI